MKITGHVEPMSFEQFIMLMNLRFKLFGRSDTIKKFDKYKSQYYNEDTDGRLVVRSGLSYIETPIEED